MGPPGGTPPGRCGPDRAPSPGAVARTPPLILPYRGIARERHPLLTDTRGWGGSGLGLSRSCGGAQSRAVT
eukprot:14739516-Alexandrium_andersonii.AAC.1